MTVFRFSSKPMSTGFWSGFNIVNPSAKSETASSTNDAMKGTITTMVLTMISLTDNVPQKEAAMKGGQSFFPQLEEDASARRWLLGLPTGLVCSWSHLCW
jgi:hypothetical protein